MAQHDALTDRRIWLAVPHEEKDMAVQRGGKKENGQNNIHWDKEAKLWFADPGTPQWKISPWLPDTSARATGSADPREEFGQALQEAGLVLNGLPIMDGKVHRVATLEDKKGKKTGGAYKGFNDRRPGGWFVNYHRATNEKDVTNWKATGGETDPLTTLHIRAGARQAADDSERARELMYAENTQKAHGLYSRLDSATDAHPYLQAKGVTADPALRLTNNNALVIPFSNVDAEFRSLQYITPEGDKSLFKEAPKMGNFFVTGGELENGQPVLYAEGYATARSLHMASGLPVVMTVDAGNMRTVAGILGERFPDSPHFFMADLDHTKKDNKGLLMAQDAAERVPNGAVITPDFTDAEKALGLTDFNDLHQSRGLEALSDRLSQDLARHSASRQATQREDIMSNASDIDANKHEQAPPDVNAPPIASILNTAGQQEADANHSAEANEPAGMPLNEKAGTQASTKSDSGPVPVNEQPAEQAEKSPQPDPESTPETAATSEQPNAGNPHVKKPAGDEPDLEIEPEAEQRAGASKKADPHTTTQTQAEQQEDGFAFGPRAPGEGSWQPDEKRGLIDTDQLLQRISWNEQKGTVQYLVDNAPAFRDHGNRITMESPEASKNNEHVMAALLTAIQHYGGKLEITGSDQFKERAIDLIASHGLKVSMKNPAQQALLDDARNRYQTKPDAKDTVQASPVTPDAKARHDANQQPRETHSATRSPSPGEGAAHTTDGQAHTGDTPQSQPTTRANNASNAEQETLDFSKGVKGQLLEYGKAPYEFDEKNRESYFVTLRTKAGPKTVWGVELESAIRESRVSEGQVINLQHLGKKAVTIQSPVHDAQGKVLHYEAKSSHRNHWQITPLVSPNVRPHDTPNAGEKLAAYDLLAFESVQKNLHKTGLVDNVPAIPATLDRLLWLRGDGRGTPERGDPLTAQRPREDPNAGKSVMTSWTEDGRMALHLMKGHGPYLQGLALINDQYHHVLASLPGKDTGPNLVINAITSEGLKYAGYGQAVNKVEGKPVDRDTMIFKLAGDTNTRIAKLDHPEKIPPQTHAALGFDERFKLDSNYPKSEPRAENHHKAQPGTGRPG